jgi:tRNA(Ser,Leu) C12 N-acetylase TAN1
VDLDDPDKIVLIQILGELTGVSIVPPGKILSVEREKRLASQEQQKKTP